MIGRRWNQAWGRLSSWWASRIGRSAPATNSPPATLPGPPDPTPSTPETTPPPQAPPGRKPAPRPKAGPQPEPPPHPRTEPRPGAEPYPASPLVAMSPPGAGVRGSSSGSATAPGLVPPVRAGDGKRSVWLWNRDGKVHASLVRTADATERRLSAAELARLMLADPSRTMPAIHSVTGLADAAEAVARLRTWQPRTPVVLHAAAPAGRQTSKALSHPGRPNTDGTVRTVSGGLPSLNKRRR